VQPEEARFGGPEPAWRLLGPPLTAAARTLFDLRVSGLRHVPPAGPALVVANHLAHLDPLVLMAAFLAGRGRRLRFLALADLFTDPVVGWLLRRARAIPVERGGGMAPAVAGVCRALDDGEVVAVYPEGRLPRGETLTARPGVGAMALATRAPVLPVALWGMQPELPGSPFRRPVAVVIGAPLRFQSDAHRDPAAVSAALLGVIRARLLPRARVRCGYPPTYPDTAPGGLAEVTGSSWRTGVALARRYFGRG
jgi:1-acyl-sn-glycerol-3-phosphate acyltransferase